MGDSGLPHVLAATEMPLAHDWSIPNHAHDDIHELVMVTAGRVETRMHGQVIVTGPGGIKYHPKRIDHAERTLDHKRAGLIFVVFREAAGSTLERLPVSANDRNGRMRMLLDWMVEITSAQSRDRDQQLGALMYALLQEYAAAAAGPPDAMILGVRAWIREHLAQPIYLDDLARIASVSRFHFARLFHKSTGRTPMEYVRRMRVESARTLLLTTDQPLRAIAPQVGFSDEFQLSRAFRQITGQPPGSLRQPRRTSAAKVVAGE